MANEPSTDYGYDLVHQDGTGRPLRGERRPDDAGVGGPARRIPERPEESAGDHGYDEAHDF